MEGVDVVVAGHRGGWEVGRWITEGWSSVHGGSRELEGGGMVVTGEVERARSACMYRLMKYVWVKDWRCEKSNG